MYGIYHYVNCINVFDLYLLNHHNTIANGVFILDLCLIRENNIVVDDQDLTSPELTFMIELLCTYSMHYIVFMLVFSSFFSPFFVFKLKVRFYVLCIHIDIFRHCALYVFYEMNKDDYYK